MIRPLIAVAATVLLASSAFAATPKTVKKVAAKPAPIVCAVTGEKIASIKDSVGTSTYKGKTYYFCCAGCKPMFDKNPAKYAKATTATATKPMHAM